MYLGMDASVKPGQGRVEERNYTDGARAALCDAVDTLGGGTVDFHLNDNAYWRDVPGNSWNYKLGGYQALKKWLSCRDHKVLGRNLTPGEVQDVIDTARRIGGILTLVNE